MICACFPKILVSGLVSGSITECKLRDNRLGVEGWSIIFNTLRNSPTSKITTWDLSTENLGPGIAKPLAEYLSVTGSGHALERLPPNRLALDGRRCMPFPLFVARDST